MTCLTVNDTAIAIVKQAAEGTFDTPTSGDRYPCSNVQLNIEGVTVENPEYLGGTMRPPPEVLGKRVTLSYDLLLRPPGGGSVPSADAYIPGRVLQAAKYTESRFATAIASEALGVGSTTNMAKLGSTAAATAGLYKGMLVSLVGMGATYQSRLTPIRAYNASKEATLMQTFGSTITGNYSIPAQLSYHLAIDAADPPYLSQDLWIAGIKYSLRDCRVTQFGTVLPTTTRDGGDIPLFRVTMDVTIDAYVDEAAPAVTALGAVPKFRDGKHYVSHFAMAGQSVEIDLGAQVERQPNPNRPDGSDPACLTATQPVISANWKATTKAELDTLALADAQAHHPWFALYGYSAGNTVCINAPDCLWDYHNYAANGGLWGRNGNLYLKVDARPLSINFPF